MTTNRKVAVGSASSASSCWWRSSGRFSSARTRLHYTSDLLAPLRPAHLAGHQSGRAGRLHSVGGWHARLGLLGVRHWRALVLVISITVGLVAGYFGGIVDDLLSVLTNVFLVHPGFPLASWPSSSSAGTTLTIAIIVALTNWPWGARVLRAQTLSLRNREFVTAARASGERTVAHHLP